MTFGIRKTRMEWLYLAGGENNLKIFYLLNISTESMNVTDGRTDRQTDRRKDTV